MVNIFSSPTFYMDYMKLPTADDPVSKEIQQNPKFWPYFKDALGAIDGSHQFFCPSITSRCVLKPRRLYFPKLPFCMSIFSSILLHSHWMGRFSNRCLTMG